MCLDLVTPSQSLIELSACFLLQYMQKKKKNGECHVDLSPCHQQFFGNGREQIPFHHV